jgi:hypothetical protein
MANTDFSKTTTEEKTVYGKSSEFKTCATCPTPAKCRAAKKCMKRAGKGRSDRQKNRGSRSM